MSSEVCAEMVANVVAVSVAPGDVVADGDMLLLLESMKMEIPVSAETGIVGGAAATGHALHTVREVRVHAGDVVQEGDVLIVLD